MTQRQLIIRTSDRGLFRRCRRKWAWQSHLKGNFEPLQKVTPLWMGTGFHFALEQMHSTYNYKTASEAFVAYYDATKKAYNIDNLPADIDKALDLACGMLDYYQKEWLASRDPLTTYVYNGEPQVEVDFQIPLPINPPKGYDIVIYAGTLDRTIIDEYNHLWIVEYKTAKQFATGHFMIDAQCTAYSWAGYSIYKLPVQGIIYQQHRKELPQAPKILRAGKISSDKSQKVTRRAYREALLNIYGNVQKAPKVNIDMLNHLSERETEDYDSFIRRDKVYRSLHQIQAEGEKILMEVGEIINPQTPLYPSPTRDCIYQCPFMSACISMDDGSDWEYEINETCRRRKQEAYDMRWREFIQPKAMEKL